MPIDPILFQQFITSEVDETRETDIERGIIRVLKSEVELAPPIRSDWLERAAAITRIRH
jgi:hypothetical protein